MEDKFFNVDEMMVDYGEMTSFDFSSPAFMAMSTQKGPEEYAQQPYTFKYGNYDKMDMLKSMFFKGEKCLSGNQ